MEGTELQESFQGMKSLQEHCCVAVAQYETRDIQKIIKKLKLPPKNLHCIADEVSVTKSTEDCMSIFGVLPSSMYAQIGLTLLCSTESSKKEHTKQMLKFLWENKNISRRDKRILSFFNFYLDISDEKKITKEEVFQKSLGHKTTPLFVSAFLLQEGAHVSEYPIEEILENRVEHEYRMQQPEFITQFLQKEEIQVMCQRSIDMINKGLPDNQKCDEEAVKYSCAYAAYNGLFLTTIKKLIELGFVPNKKGFLPQKRHDQNNKDNLSAFDFVVLSMQDWKSNYALRNTAYAKYMLTVWDTPESHDMNIICDAAITRYYHENPNNSKKVDFLRAMRATYYRKRLNAFLTIKHYFYEFSYKALKRLKQFYPEEFNQLKAKKLKKKQK